MADDLHEQLHYLTGTCDLAMKHRDIAEAKVERLTAALQVAWRCLGAVIGSDDYYTARSAIASALED